MTPTPRDIVSRLAPLAAIVATICVMATGCGGGDDSPAAADMPEPRSYPAFAEHVAALLAEAEDQGDCKRIEAINRRSSESLPCPAPKALRERMDSFELVDAAVFNADRSAVVDYETGEVGKTTSMLLLRSYEGPWTVVRLDINPERTPANAPGEGGVHVRHAIRRYEAAVRRRDCRELLRFVYRPAGTPRPSCEEQLAATAPLARVLKGDPEQRPAFNGGSQDFGFYSMTAYRPKPTHHTITVVRTELGGDDRYFVSDVVRDEG
jgi:hypothetical protein